jgi:hypothetical protein
MGGDAFDLRVQIFGSDPSTRTINEGGMQDIDSELSAAGELRKVHV